MSNEELGFWMLPKPDMFIKSWNKIPRVAKTIPFGYEIDEEDDDFLVPIDIQLDALDKAKQHLKQYSYREVAAWLSTQSERYISHVGLYKRVKIEQQRKNEASTQRYLAQRYKEALQKAEKLETQRLGYRERVSSSPTEA